VFTIIAIVAAVLGAGGSVGTATGIAWALFAIGLIPAVVFAIIGRRPPSIWHRRHPFRAPIRRPARPAPVRS
jgi:uncharacterized membrane protein YtjA (UPF0391 family)